MTCSLLPGLALREGTLRAAPQVSELVDLRWEQVDFNHAVLRVRTKPPPPAIANRTVKMPRRRPNAELRSREHLTDAEIERLMTTAWNNRWGPPRRDHDGDREE